MEQSRYEYEVDTSSNSAASNVVRMVGRNKHVLEVGCGPGSITKILAQVSNCKMVAMELNPTFINKAKPYCDEIFQADLNSSEWPNLLDNLDKFDVVVAADVLEHLYDPWKTLQRMVPLINSTGSLVISLPHVGHAAIMSCLINGDFNYCDSGLLDRTHIRFFGLSNIESLFSQANLKIIQASYICVPPEETELAEDWSKISPAMKKMLMSCKHSEIYQVVIKAVPLHFEGEPVKLVPPKQRGYIASGKNKTNTGKQFNFNSFKARVGRHLSPELKARIQKNFARLGLKL